MTLFVQDPVNPDANFLLEVALRTATILCCCIACSVSLAVEIMSPRGGGIDVEHSAKLGLEMVEAVGATTAMSLGFEYR